jgi:hypothetical protein
MVAERQPLVAPGWMKQLSWPAPVTGLNHQFQ